jgi:protein-S-isoprenylcysteine O-methyltransferase Ste14
MRPQTHNPTETFLGSIYVREDLLRQEAHNSRVGRVAHRLARWVRTFAKIVFILLVVGISAAVAFGPGAAIGWFVTYLIPMAVITGAIIASLALLVWVVNRSPDPSYRDRLQ